METIIRIPFSETLYYFEIGSRSIKIKTERGEYLFPTLFILPAKKDDLIVYRCVEYENKRKNLLELQRVVVEGSCFSICAKINTEASNLF